MTERNQKTELLAAVDRLAETGDLTDDELLALLLCNDTEANDYLAAKAREVREK